MKPTKEELKRVVEFLESEGIEFSANWQMGCEGGNIELSMEDILKIYASSMDTFQMEIFCRTHKTVPEMVKEWGRCIKYNDVTTKQCCGINRKGVQCKNETEMHGFSSWLANKDIPWWCWCHSAAGNHIEFPK